MLSEERLPEMKNILYSPLEGLQLFGTIMRLLWVLPVLVVPLSWHKEYKVIPTTLADHFSTGRGRLSDPQRQVVATSRRY